MRRKTTFYLCLPILIISVIFSACSLSRDESSGPSYDEMQEKIEKYNTELNEFRKKNDSADSSRIIETETPQTVSPSWIRYYGADGSEISDRELIAEFTDESEFNWGGAGSGELGLIYFFEAFILLLGIVFIRYFKMITSF